jgi:hypothetical protein
MMRRWAALLAGLVVVVIGLPASAGELEDHLEERARLSLRGEQLISCSTEDGVDTALLQVAMADGSTLSWVAAEDERATSVPVAVPGLWELADRYQATLVDETEYLGVPADLFVISEGDIKRVELLFDQATSVMVSLTTFQPDGTEICQARMLSWDLDRSVALTAAEEPSGSELLPLTNFNTIAAQIAGFDLTASGQTESYLVGRYADGIFSFTLTVFDDIVELTELNDPQIRDIGRNQYLVDVQSFGRTLHHWTVGNDTYLLVGDLPSDLSEEVLDELPAPRTLGFWERIRSIFG